MVNLGPSQQMGRVLLKVYLAWFGEHDSSVVLLDSDFDKQFFRWCQVDSNVEAIGVLRIFFVQLVKALQVMFIILNFTGAQVIFDMLR